MEKKKDKKSAVSFAMMLVTIGIVYGDIGTSPMYVMKSIIGGNGGIGNVDADFIIGSLSLIIWTVTLLTTVKYVLIAMKADNNGEGGIFSLYTLVRDYGKWLIIPAMLGGAALLADGLLTPAVTVTTAVEGLRSIEVMNRFLGSGQARVIIITLVIITALFSVQHAGTSSIGKAFGPIMLVWFVFLACGGVYNIITMPVILKAFNPVYAVKVLLSPYNKAGIMILGSVFLATTGAEALYSDMGHVGRGNVYCSWPFVKVCLILNYLGQGAWIVMNSADASLRTVEDLNPFFMMLPEALRPFAVIIGALAAVIASQALITGSFTLVSEAIHLDLMPHLEIRYPSDTKGQLFIDVVNKILWIGCCAVVLYFRSGARIESAYGLAITITMLMTTLLLSVYLRKVRKLPVVSYVMLVVFGLIETVFFVSSLGKFTAGGYVTAIIALLLLLIEIIWHKGTAIEKKYAKKLRIDDYIKDIEALHEDDSIAKTANNLVYLLSNEKTGDVDRDVLYSILDKDTKRADAYWFVNVKESPKPKVLNYSVETFNTDCVFWIDLSIGFKHSPRINVYLRKIVKDLLSSSELPVQEKKYSIYGPSEIGTFKFCVIHKTFNSKSELSQLDELILGAKYAIRKAAGSKVRWYGLDTSSVITENVPLIVGGGEPVTLRRIQAKTK